MASKPSFDDLLQCSICLERFTQPKALPCMHTFCLSCLRGIIKDAGTVDCPTCRRTHQVPEQGAAGFHDNLMAANLLSMFGGLNECTDCGRKEILSECEQCKQHVCAECRAGHIVLQAEITVLIKSIRGGVNDFDERSEEIARSNLRITKEVQNEVNDTYQAAVAALTARRDEIIRKLETMAKFENAIVEGKLDVVIEETRQELSKCVKSENLKELKSSLRKIEEMMEKPVNLSEWASFGDSSKLSGGRSVELGARTASSAAAPDGALGHLSLLGKLEGHSGQVQSECPGQLSRFPSCVDYAGKVDAWRLVISKAAAGCEELKPTCAVYSQTDSALYCLSAGKLLRYDHKSGAGAVACSLVQARDMALTESGTLLLIDDRHIVRITAEARSEEAFTFTFSSLPVGTNATQICCHRRESLVLDSAGHRLLRFREDGKLIGEIKSDELVLDEKSRMCVDKEGRIYVSGGNKITRKNSEESHSTCCNAPKNVTISWFSAISVLNWEGEVCEEVLMDRKSKDFVVDYDETETYRYGNLTPCPRECEDHKYMHQYHASDEKLIKELDNEILVTQVTSLSLRVDGDGYLSLTRAGRHQVDVYNPDHEHHVTIEGNMKDPTGLSLTPDGRLVVCDTGNNRIQII